MQKVPTKTIQGSRGRSFECIDCLNLYNCKFAKTLAVFERNFNVEIDCWVRKRHKNMFYTGFHKPMFLPVENPFSGTLLNIHRWLHALSEKYDIVYENHVHN